MKWFLFRIILENFSTYQKNIGIEERLWHILTYTIHHWKRYQISIHLLLKNSKTIILKKQKNTICKLKCDSDLLAEKI